MTARPAVERGELVATDNDNGDAGSLEMFQGQGDVENRLHTGAHDADRRDGQFGEIGRDVERRDRAAMHATHTTGREDADAGERGEVHRGSNGRRASRPRRHQPREITRCCFVNVAPGRQQLDLGCGQANSAQTVDDGDRRWSRAARTNNRLDITGHLDVLRVGHPVTDDGRLQRHHWLTGQDCPLDLVTDFDAHVSRP